MVHCRTDSAFSPTLSERLDKMEMVGTCSAKNTCADSPSETSTFSSCDPEHRIVHSVRCFCSTAGLLRARSELGCAVVRAGGPATATAHRLSSPTGTSTPFLFLDERKFAWYSEARLPELAPPRQWRTEAVTMRLDSSRETEAGDQGRQDHRHMKSGSGLPTAVQPPQLPRPASPDGRSSPKSV
jgi:hypothetical protein